MPNRSSKKRPRDINQFAAAIVEQAATSETEPPTTEQAERQVEAPAKNPAAVELGRLGGLKGGKARADRLSPERRKEIAKQAAAKRWEKQEQT